MARKVGLLFLILVFGGGIETAWQVRQSPGFGPLGCRVLRGRFYGPSFTFDAEERREVPAGTSVEVQNAFGGVRVLAGAPGEVKVNLRKVVFRATEEQAREFASRIRLVTSLEGSTLRIATNREDLEWGEGRDVGFETHLEIAVPPQTALKVRNEHGRLEASDLARADVSTSFEALQLDRVAGPAVVSGAHGDVAVSGVQGTLELTSRHGQVSVQDLGAAAVLRVRHGDVSLARTGAVDLEAEHGHVRIEDVRGDLDVRAQHAEVEATRVAGRCAVQTTHEKIRVEGVGGEARLNGQHGSISATDVKGRLVAETTHDDVILTRIGGPVEVGVQHGGVRADGLDGGARIKAVGDEVVLLGFKGDVDVDAARAGVRLVPGAAITAPLRVKTSFGGIALEVPPGSAFELDAQATRGELSVNVPGLTLTQSGSSRVTGRVGAGGGLVRLETEHGDVLVTPGTAAVAEGAGPSSPAPAASPVPPPAQAR